MTASDDRGGGGREGPNRPRIPPADDRSGGGRDAPKRPRILPSDDHDGAGGERPDGPRILPSGGQGGAGRAEEDRAFDQPPGDRGLVREAENRPRSNDPLPPRGPRVIIEEDAPVAPRLDFQWEQAVVPVAAPRPASRWSGLGRAVGGVAVLGLGLAALDAANFVVDQFGRGPVQGWATILVVAGGAALLASGVWREVRGLLGIRAVDRGRAAFARGDLAEAKAEALRWAASIQEAAVLQPAIRGAASVEELRALLHAPLEILDDRAGALGRSAAVQAFAVTAISPSPGLDALVFAWRGVRLVRQVAALHGLRPGVAGTLALLRRTLFDAATVAATDVAVDAAARALLSNKLLEQFAGEAAAGAVAARRMLRLARVAAEACRVVPRDG